MWLSSELFSSCVCLNIDFVILYYCTKYDHVDISISITLFCDANNDICSTLLYI